MKPELTQTVSWPHVIVLLVAAPIAWWLGVSLEAFIGGLATVAYVRGWKIA